MRHKSNTAKSNTTETICMQLTCPEREECWVWLKTYTQQQKKQYKFINFLVEQLYE